MLRLTVITLGAVAGMVSRPLPGWQAKPVSSAPAPASSGLVLRTVRFYRADQDRTRVKGLVQIPFSLMQPAGGSDGSVHYAISVRVADSTGLTLYQQAWKNHAPAVAVPDAYTVEIVDFAVAPGRYHLDVTVEDSVSGRKASGAADIQALSDSDKASDLLLAPEMRLATSNDTVPRSGEFRTGNNLVTAAARVILTPLRAKVYYLLEAYAASNQTGSLSVQIRDSTGKPNVKTPDVPVTVAAGGSVLSGQLDLTGLPEGEYTVVSSLSLGGQRIERSASIYMTGLQQTLVRDSARRESERATDEGYFASLSEKELEDAKAPLLYIAEGNELSSWKKDMSLEAKRRFLTRFWQKRDPSPGSPRNERREVFYEAIDYANRAFREGGRNTVPGWRSDRGRIYAKYGAPDDTYKRQQEGNAPPYQVWRYTRERDRYYIFADRTGFGAYNLIETNDLHENRLANWGQILGYEAVEDIGRYLGKSFLAY
jgi:GWxTD domain-containing protein